MKRRTLIVICLAVFACVCVVFGASSVTAFASDADTGAKKVRLIDYAGLLTEGQNAEISARLDEISEKRECDIAIVTVGDFMPYDGAEPVDSIFAVELFADRIYDSMGFGYGESKDGIMLTVCLNSELRYYDILGNGYGTELMDVERESILDSMYDDMRSGNYADAFLCFAEECDDAIHDDKTVGIVGFAVAFGVGALFAFFVVSGMKAKLKTVAPQKSAADYIKTGSMEVTLERDIFLYKNVSRTQRVQESSSGGRSGGGGGGGRSHGGRSF